MIDYGIVILVGLLIMAAYWAFIGGGKKMKQKNQNLNSEEELEKQSDEESITGITIYFENENNLELEYTEETWQQLQTMQTQPERLIQLDNYILLNPQTIRYIELNTED